MSEEHPARAVSKKSIAAVKAKRKEDWLALFAADAVIEDPVGKYLSQQWTSIAPEYSYMVAFGAVFVAAAITLSIGIHFEVRESYAAGSECANVGTISIGMPNGMKARCDGVFVYRVDDAGKLVSLRAHWEFDQMMKTIS
jgi:hypothetical protein